jgi:hypothetical protein
MPIWLAILTMTTGDGGSACGCFEARGILLIALHACAKTRCFPSCTTRHLSTAGALICLAAICMQVYLAGSIAILANRHDSALDFKLLFSGRLALEDVLLQGPALRAAQQGKRSAGTAEADDPRLRLPAFFAQDQAAYLRMLDTIARVNGVDEWIAKHAQPAPIAGMAGAYAAALNPLSLEAAWLLKVRPCLRFGGVSAAVKLRGSVGMGSEEDDEIAFDDEEEEGVSDEEQDPDEGGAVTDEDDEFVDEELGGDEDDEEM